MLRIVIATALVLGGLAPVAAADSPHDLVVAAYWACRQVEGGLPEPCHQIIFAERAARDACTSMIGGMECMLLDEDLPPA